MKSITFYTFIFIQLSVFSQTSNCFYEETNNIVVIEAEDIDTGGLWSVENDVVGFSGSGYLEWGNGSYFNTPGTGKFSVNIKINNTGLYRFQWRSKVGAGTSPTDENDTWLRFPDADDFFGQRGSSIVYPKGSGKTPTPEGSGSDGWFKVYSSETTNWNWSASTSDNDPHNIFVQFDTPGTYTMEISARSEFHLLDRIVLSKSVVSNPTSLSIDEAECTTNTLSVTDITNGKNFKVFPNPLASSNKLSVTGIQPNSYKVTIMDIVGKQLSRKVNLEFKNDVEELEIGYLKSGLYFFTLSSKDHLYSTKLVIE
ncbi:T9SS type A sorting domain-containing protein [Confluentibacter citreus]|uniref:T9SS type A sorting domain-containing protein n=1 Tax=Confluentibacter citreus TaxID=2007307 RepID=UPI000C2823BB|nr:T9SS type A sorting domain-containing protein [Confluentibacter citreus]